MSMQKPTLLWSLPVRRLRMMFRLVSSTCETSCSTFTRLALSPVFQVVGGLCLGASLLLSCLGIITNPLGVVVWGAANTIFWLSLALLALRQDLRLMRSRLP